MKRELADKVIIVASIALNMAVLVYAADLYLLDLLGPQTSWYDAPVSYVTETWATLRSFVGV